MEAHEIGNLIASSKVEGTAVYNTAGESLGEIDDLMIDKLSGKVAYAIMSFGGFLGSWEINTTRCRGRSSNTTLVGAGTWSISISNSLRAPRPTMRTPNPNGAIEPMRSVSMTTTARSLTGACNYRKKCLCGTSGRPSGRSFRSLGSNGSRVGIARSLRLESWVNMARPAWGDEFRNC